MSAKKKKSPLKQLTLNFGQNSTIPNQCKECGLFYSTSDREDIQLHEKIHNERENSLKYFASKGEKIVQEYYDGKCLLVEYGVDSKQAASKALQVLDYVDADLGIRSEIKSNLEFNQSNLNSIKFYLFVSFSFKKIVGFCMAEKIHKAFKIKFLDEKSNSFTYDEEAPEKATCGISRIWVAPSMRRNKIATRLLDCVRINFMYFRSLKLDEIAFSDPTQFGQALAKKYFSSNHFLVYRNSQN